MKEAVLGTLGTKAILGNHDYHWSKTPTGDPLAQRVEGAKWALDELKVTERYHSFDAGGWRFLMLDSVAWENRGYHAELDAPQVEWLKAELARTPKTMPILVNSHISIFGACGFNEPKTLKGDPKNGHWEIPTGWMHADALAIKEMFKGHGNVRLCLSGHMHQLDDVTLAGTRYLCAGAISGNWWTSNRYFDTDRGFVVADLHPDGKVETQYVSYDGAPSLRL
ncbi:MAG: metallophosphoesterase [Proteobacteria bacterium]|nr:MAG: metallophosphoesterase [Pseudomonadota bacterium]